MKIHLLRNEINIIILILIVVAVFGIFDIFQETGLVGSAAISYETNKLEIWTHIIKDVLVTVFSILVSVWLILKLLKTEQLSHEQAINLKEKSNQIESLNKDLITWKQSSEKWRKGLLVEIENQMGKWGLSPAEREISLLLLKGLSYKEIAEVRQTSESTIRGQAQKIYEKSNLSSRSELSAFFLEDLL